MSQEKVDRYKEEKKGRKAKILKQKRRNRLWKILGPILVILFLAFIGAGAYFIPKWTTQYAEDNSADEIDYEELMRLINQSADEITADTDEGNDTSVTSDISADSQETSE